MEAQLHCDLRLLSSPYHRDSIDVWGEVALSIELGGSREPLLVWQWDLDQLGDWYTENVEALCSGELVIEGERPQTGESLCEAIDRFRDLDFEGVEQGAFDQWFDAIYAYRIAHVLRFGLRGTRIPDIVIGCHHGAGEISLSSWQSEQTDYEERPLPADAYVKLGRWSYRFDMHAFLVELHEGLARILTEWLVGERDPLARQRVEKLLLGLPGVPCGECCGGTG